MERFLILLSVLFSLNSYAALPAGAPTAGYGGSPLVAQSPSLVIANSDLSKKFAISCGSGNANLTSGNYYRCVKMGTQATSQENYQVTSGKIAYCGGFYFSANTTGMGMSLGYGTAAVTNDNASAPAGDKFFAGGASMIELTGGAVNTPMWISLPISFPASSFPYMKAATGAAVFSVQLICEEQ